jgi:hypothetical protein
MGTFQQFDFGSGSIPGEVSNPPSPYVTPVRNISWQTTPLPGGSPFPSGTIMADAVIEERSDDESVITENPVEQGSVIADHAYDLPQDLELTYVWSAGAQPGRQQSFLNNIYQQFLDLKQAKILCSVVTGKRGYANMLVKGISTTTDRDSENILMLRISFHQILMAVTQTVNTGSASFGTAAQQAIPQKTNPTVNLGTVQLQSAPNFNPGPPVGS